MNEMIERVARAIQADHHSCAPLRHAIFDGVPSYYEDMAQAAIAAMREPTEAMLNAARDWSLKSTGKGLGMMGSRDAGKRCSTPR